MADQPWYEQLLSGLAAGGQLVGTALAGPAAGKAIGAAHDAWSKPVLAELEKGTPQPVPYYQLPPPPPVLEAATVVAVAPPQPVRRWQGPAVVRRAEARDAAEQAAAVAAYADSPQALEREARAAGLRNGDCFTARLSDGREVTYCLG